MVVLLKKIVLMLTILPLASPLILEISEKTVGEEVELECLSWRISVEANNNLSHWKQIPKECGEYVKRYMRIRGYESDVEKVCWEAKMYARTLNFTKPKHKYAWIFDIDETLISNIPYYHHHGYGLEIFNSTKFDEWVDMGIAPAIDPVLRLYEEVLRLGFKIIILGGRSQSRQSITIHNLLQAGFTDWDKLILRSPEDHGKKAMVYKSEKRKELVLEGYEIVGNCGDQWSDILGSSMSKRSFKLPNPMYCIP